MLFWSPKLTTPLTSIRTLASPRSPAPLRRKLLFPNEPRLNLTFQQQQGCVYTPHILHTKRDSVHPISAWKRASSPKPTDRTDTRDTAAAPAKQPFAEMVVRVGGSFAYLPGDGMLTFEDHVQTVGDLRAAIEEKTQIPGKKQASRVFSLVLSLLAPRSLARASSSSIQIFENFGYVRIVQRRRFIACLLCLACCALFSALCY